MAVTVDALVARLGAGEPDTDQAGAALAVAVQLVTDYVAAGLDDPTVVPAVILDEATLRVAVDAYNKVDAPNGVLMSAIGESGDGSDQVLRVSSDPLYSARRFLAPYVPPLGFA